MKLATVTRSFAKCILAALMAVACTAEAVNEKQAPEITEPVSLSATPGKAFVEFDEEMIGLIEEELEAGGIPTKAPALSQALQELGIVSLERVFPDAGEYEPRSRREGLHRFYKVEFTRTVPVTKAVTSLADVPGVVSVTPVRKIQRRSFNDPYFSRQWHYSNNRYPDADINVEPVWEQYTTGSKSVIVNIVDGGVWAAHPDLSANMWDDGKGHFGYNFVYNNYNVAPDGHGTHVAGIIAAVNNNGVGVSGIAGGDAASGIPGVRIMSCPIFDGDDQADDANSARAIKWGADHGAVLCNNSWGFGADGCLDGDPDGRVSQEELNQYKQWSIDPVYKAAIDYFIKYAGCDNDGNQLPDSPMKGGLVFFASGNENIDYDIISSYEPVISVGATSLNGSRASYSCYGSYVDIAAPGGDGYTSANSIWSTVPLTEATSGYAGTGWAGTSMACPHAVGVAALVVSYFGQPGFTQETCREILLGGLGKAIGGNRPIGKKLDALSIFQYGEEVMAGFTPDVPEEQFPPEISLSQSQVTVKAHETVKVSVSVTDPNNDKVTVRYTPGSAALVYNPVSQEITISGRDAPAGTYRAYFIAEDPTFLTAEATLEYTILPNHAPRVSLQQEDLVIQKATSLIPYFIDEDGETLSIAASSSNPQILRLEVTETSCLLTPLSNGVTTVTFTATDNIGVSASQSFRVAVRKSARPMEMYPVPASTEVHFWPDSREEQTLKVSLYSLTGSLVKTAEFTAGVFLPVTLDISALAPGKYTAVLEYGGETWRETLVKI